MRKQSSSRSDLLYRRLLRLLPFAFQREYGSDMEGVFRQERKHARKRGLRSAVRLWWRTIAGLLLIAPREHMDVLRQDIRFGVRSLAKHPGFTFVSIVALAVGIGASLAVFALINTLLLRPLPVLEPDRVIRVFANTFSNMDYNDYVEYRDRNQTTSELSAFGATGVSIQRSEFPESAAAVFVSGNYFPSLGVTARLGRTIGVDDDRPAAPAAAVLSDSFWRRRFGADPEIAGRSLVINGTSFTIAGVAPPSFTGTMAPFRPDFWIPWNSLTRGRPHSVLLMGRLRNSVTLEQAASDFSAIASQLAKERGRPVRVSLYSARALHPEFYAAVAVFSGFLMAIVGLVLTIACLNIATMLLARSAERRREIGIRLALGAGRGQLVRQLLTEGLLMSLTGGAVAVFVAVAAARTVSISIAGVPMESLAIDFDFDWRVGIFAVGVSILTTVLFGLVPALQCTKTDVTPALKDGTLTTAPTRSRLRAAFIVAQVALSALLLVIGALLVRTLTNPQLTGRGFDTAGVLTAGFQLASAGYSGERGLEFQQRLLQVLEGTPGVMSANVVMMVPLTLSNDETVMDWNGSRIRFNSNGISRGHFRTLQIPFIEGRDFDDGDRSGSAAVAIINERFARRLWPGESAVGKRLDDVEIVGVVRDSKYIAITEQPRYFVYRPFAQARPSAEATLLVRTAGDAMNVLPAVRAAVRSLDPYLPLSNISSLEEATRISLLPLRIAAALAGVLGMVALILGAIGIYGVVAYLARQRSREIGIRMALGATASGVVRVMTRQIMSWTAVGLGLGLLAGFAAAQLLANLVFGIAQNDPVLFGGIAVLLASTAYVAGWLPARRATRIDPLAALREE